MLSDTALGLCKLQNKLNPNRSPFPVAYTFAVRKSRTKLKQVSATKLKQVSAARSKNSTAAFLENIQDHRRSGESQIETGELQASVRRFLNGLPSIDRHIVEARHFDHQTWDTIAALVEMPKTSVVRRYQAVLALARQALAPWN